MRRQKLTGGSVTNIEALRHSMYSLLSSVNIFVSWNKNSATGWWGAFIWRTIGVLVFELSCGTGSLSVEELVPIPELVVAVDAPEDGFLRPVSVLDDDTTELSVEIM